MQKKLRKNLNAKMIMDILKKNRDFLKKFQVRKIGLFGSYLKGREDSRSDIDFLVDFENPSYDNFMELVFCLENFFHKKIELITKGNLSPYIAPFVEKEVQWYEA